MVYTSQAYSIIESASMPAGIQLRVNYENKTVIHFPHKPTAKKRRKVSLKYKQLI